MRHLKTGITTFIIFLSGITGYSRQPFSSPEFKREFLTDINQIRQKGCNCGGVYMPPAPPIAWNDELEIAAVEHAKDMADKAYFSHTSTDGRTMQDRIISAGYTYKGFKSYNVGENIAQGQMSISQVMEGWFNSPGHCKNLMNPAFKEIGVAEYNTYWVQDFGGRQSFTAQEQEMIKSGRLKVIERH